MTAFGRPVAAEDVGIEMLYDALRLAFIQMQHAIGDQREHGPALRYATHFVVEGVEIEPVGRLRRRDEIDGRSIQTASLSRRRAVLHSLVRVRVRNLLRTCISRDDAREALRQQHGELPRSTSAVERQTHLLTHSKFWQACLSCDLKDKCYAFHNAMTFQDPTAGPQVVNEDPYVDGWICTIRMSDPGQFDALLDPSAYLALVEG